MNLYRARSNMIGQQIRPWNVLENKTLEALESIRREDFVPRKYRHLAFADMQILLADDQVMLEPKVSARLVESLALQSDCRVLEIGTGSGYVTALMACLCEHVTSLEINPDLAEQARRNLAIAGIDNIEIFTADCFEYCGNFSDHAGKFDRVIVTGSLPEVAPIFLPMLRKSGLVVGIQGNEPTMQAVVCHSEGRINSLFETNSPRLKNVYERASFEF